ncbi:EAL domain-containing protein [Nodosilinea sp. P-1105]|uniref:EAL domain-containing protein n=1 Tax=Nodosilinea sp. P-1105 TaxID=2546229 RepID=UPI0019821696|nr:EAL domain-containing protein [Nodosilinea sp. P-1105]
MWHQVQRAVVMDNQQPLQDINLISPDDWASTPEPVKHLVKVLMAEDRGAIADCSANGAHIKALRAQIQREQTLNRVFQSIRNSLDLDTIFATAATEMGQLLPPFDCCIVRYIPDQLIWHTVAAFHHSSEHPSTTGLKIPDANNPCSAQLRRQQVVRINDTRSLQDPVNQSVAEITPGAWLLTPLVVDGRLWGCFSLLSPHPLTWSDDQVALAQAVATQLEVAIYQASLYQRLHQELNERRQVEAALWESQNRFQAMAANVPGAIFRYVLRPDGSDGVLYMSQGCLGLWEVEADAVLKDASLLWQMVHPDDRPGMQDSVLESARTLEPWHFAWRIITPAGREKWLEAAGQPTRHANGNVVWDTLILDVSDRKQAELRFQTLAANTPGVIYQYVLHPNGTDTMTYVSPGCRDVWELSPQQIMDDVEATWRMVALEDLLPLRQSVLESAHTLNLWTQEWKITTPSKQVRWLQGTARPHRQANGDVVWDGLILDITKQQLALEQRQQAEAALMASERRLSTLISNLPGFVYRCQNNSDYTSEFISQGVTRVTGYTPDEYLRGDVSYGQHIHPDDLQAVWDLAQAALQAHQPYECEYRIITKAGEERWVWERGQGIYAGDGSLQWLEGFITDISDRKQAEAAMRDSEARYRLLAENSKDLVCLHQLDGQYLYVSPSCQALLGYQYTEMWQQYPGQFIHSEDRPRVLEELKEAANGGKTVPITYRMRQRSGRYRWFETLTKPILDGDGQIIQIQTTSRDVTERIQAQEQLQYDALHDSLTGLPNRHLLMDRLDLAICRARRLNCYDFAVIFLDLDRFKVINDSLGHLAGDQLLVTIAQRLRSVLKEPNLVARLGGDEFVILLENIQDFLQVVQVTERLFEALRYTFRLDTRDVYTTASAGIVLASPDYREAVHLLRDADIAMYRAKTKGKACYEIFDAAMHAQAMHRLHLENDLRRAIDNQEFVLHYQPIVTLDTGQLAGFEALIRWQHPHDGLKSPGEFIAIAEEIGLISAIDCWGLAAACQQLADWQAAFPQWADLKINVNLSAQDLQRPNLLAEIDQVLAQTGLRGQSLTLEITESMLIEDIETTIDLLSQLKQRGLQISIDDFGTGYSSLSYLHRLPVNSLKVDRSFVNQIQDDHKNHQIIETIMALSRPLNLDTVAEGIETQLQVDWLRRLGYDLGQGYFFSRPLTAEAATDLLARSLTWPMIMAR